MKTKKVEWRRGIGQRYLAEVGGLHLLVYRGYSDFCKRLQRPGHPPWRSQVCGIGIMGKIGPPHLSPHVARRDAEGIAFAILRGMRAIATELLIQYGQLGVDAADGSKWKAVTE